MLLILTLLLSDPVEDARARAALAFAFAQQGRAVERLAHMPEEARPPKAKPDLSRLTLEDGAALAAKARLPLLVWVGNYDDAELRSRLPKCVQVRVESWKGSAEKGIVCAPLYGGGRLGIINGPWPHSRRLIPVAEASADEVLKELSGVWLRTSPRSAAPETERPAIRPSVSVAPNLAPRWSGGAVLRGASC